ncbi:MAG: V-type ATP synthase subunit I [Sedimentisphaerales bacterium]
MSIAKMQKVLIASYRTQAGELLNALQAAGIIQILNAEQAMVSKDYPELQSSGEKPRQLEEKLEKLELAITFLDKYAEKKGGIIAALAPKTVIEEKRFFKIASGTDNSEFIEKIRQLQREIENIKSESETITAQVQNLLPWENFATPVEELDKLNEAAAFAGFLSLKSLADMEKNYADICVIQKIQIRGNSAACVVVCLRQDFQETQKALRSCDFEAANFAGLKGTVSEIIKSCRARLLGLDKNLEEKTQQAKKFSGELLELQILADDCRNLLNRHKTQLSSPHTEQTIILEGWVKKSDLKTLNEITKRFSAVSVRQIEPSADEPVPVELENNRFVRPFETVTRLYGMPQYTNIDPTIFLAPFFAIFFGMCIADVGYGLMLAPVLWWLTRKLQMGKLAVMMFLMCCVTIILAGLITGSWFGDTFTSLIPEHSKAYSVLNGVREKLILFDPMAQPMIAIVITLAMGYFQIMFGFSIAMVNNLINKNFVGAVCDQLVWLVFLNNFSVIALIKFKVIPAGFMPVSIVIAIICAMTILLFSIREGSWGARIGMGAFGLFSAVFTVGDILSYVRIMALGMVGAGLGMAINVLVKMLMDIPYVGFLLGAILFVVGHTFNLAMSILGAFVHSMRLQFVEFFPKFFSSGGIDFTPMSKDYKYVMMKTEVNE